MQKLLARFSVAQGKAQNGRILDFVRRTLILETPEERVRQEVLRCLHFDYGYPHSSLGCEELIARGTSDRTRADVVVRLPRRPKISLAAAKPETAWQYSDWTSYVRPSMSPQVRVVEIGDTVTLTFDGTEASLKLLGFNPGTECVTADFAASPALLRRGYPEVIELVVLGAPASAPEKELATKLGLRNDTTEHGGDFLEGLALYGTGLAQDAWPTSATQGYFVRRDEGRGVLLDVDASVFAEEDEGLEPAESERVPEDQKEAYGGDVLMVIECKAPHVGLAEDTWMQARTYAEKLAAPLCVMTNGLQHQSFLRSDGAWLELEEIPTYEEAIAREELLVCAIPDFEWISRFPAGVPTDDLLWAWLRSFSIPTERLSETQRLATCRLASMLLLNERLLNAPTDSEPSLIDDLGNSTHRSGFPGAGEFRDRFRSVEVRSSRHSEEFIVGAAVSTELFRKEEWAGGAVPVPFGPCLNVGTITGARLQNVLQLDLPRYLEVEGDEAVIWHDGTLTAGRGAVRRAVTMEAVKKDAPHLLKKDRIELFRFNTHHEATPQLTVALMQNLAAYAVVRMSVRDEAKAARKRK